MMKKKQNMRYGLDMKYELETYKHVGRTYGGKERFNKKEKKYAHCDTHSEWEEHVKKKLPVNINNYSDFLHWLYRQRDYAEHYVEAIKCILIPIYVALVAVPELFDVISGRLTSLVIIIILIVISVASTTYLSNAMSQMNFYRDFIQIAENEKKLATKVS